jgi:hypothetical protein
MSNRLRRSRTSAIDPSPAIFADRSGPDKNNRFFI